MPWNRGPGWYTRRRENHAELWRFVRNLIKSDHILSLLEIGGGDGYASQFVPRYCCVDINRNAILSGVRRCGAEYIHADWNAMELGDIGEWDMVAALAVVEHCESYRRLIARAGPCRHRSVNRAATDRRHRLVSRGERSRNRNHVRAIGALAANERLHPFARRPHVRVRGQHHARRRRRRERRPAALHPLEPGGLQREQIVEAVVFVDRTGPVLILHAVRQEIATHCRQRYRIVAVGWTAR